ncbi:MAG: hypothetical protein APF76_04755 [Desulfitibacter sp. BRH_c19]|nr:MAG: hypothetical protein APF76_04755 [Desulfitibacter sp. BRH_c19]
MKTINSIYRIMKLGSHEFEPFIRYIRFPYYKQLAEGERIDFEFPFTALVGANGCSKSSVLQALYGCPGGNNTGIFWFSTDVDVIREKSYPNCFIYGYWSKNPEDIVEVIKTRINKKDKPDYWEPSRPIVNYGMKKLPKINKSTNMEDRTKTRWRAIKKDVLYLDFKSGIGAFDKFFWHGMFNKTETLKTKQDYIRHKAKLLRRVINDNSKSYKYFKKEKIKKNVLLSKKACEVVSSILGAEYKEIRLVEHSFYGNLTAPSVILNKKGLQYSEAFAGSGETAVVVLVHSIMNASEKSLILLDEPETSLHPKAQQKLQAFLLEQIKKHKHQIIISTHSPTMIRNLPPEAIKIMYLESDDIKGAKIRVRPRAYPEEAFNVIGNTDANKIKIYVEDNLTKAFVDVYIEKLKSNLKNFVEVIYIPGGADSIIKYSVSDAVATSDINTIFIFDGDKHWPNREPINQEYRKKLSNYMVNGKVDEAKIPEADNEILSDIVKELVGCEIHLYLDGNPLTGSDGTKKIKQLRDFLKFWTQYVYFFPGKQPEKLLYKSISDEDRKHYFKDIDNIESVDWKEYFKKKTEKELAKTKVSSTEILTIQRQIIAKFQDQCEVFKLINDIIDIHFNNRNV